MLMASGSWQDEQAPREALGVVAPKLAVLGLRIDRRKTGLRMAKVRAS
jgi:hypothetical protein